MTDETERAVYLHRNALLKEIQRAYESMDDVSFMAYLRSLKVPENFDDYEPQGCEACMCVFDIDQMHSSDDGYFCKPCVEAAGDGGRDG